MTIVWPAADFSPLLQGGIPRNNSLRVRENQFGGGYRAGVPEGLNQVAMKVTFSVVTNENVPGQKLIDLETLIQQGRGTEPYSIRFAGEQSDRLVTIKNWTPNARSPWVHFVSIDAESFNDPASLLATVPGAYRLSYAPTWLVGMSIALSIGNCSFAVGVRDAVSATTFDLRSDGLNGAIVNVHSRWVNDTAYADIGSSVTGRTSVATAGGGLTQFGRTGSTNTLVTSNSNATSVGTATLLPDAPLFFSWNNTTYLTRTITFGAIGQGLTLAEMNADRVTINAYQMALGRAN